MTAPILRRMELSGKVALVTGGAHRVGRALSLALADAGADVVIDYYGSETAAEETREEITARGRRAVPVKADVSSGTDVRRLVKTTADTLGRLDVVVNSASTFVQTPFLGIDEDEWDRVLAVNLKGPFLMAQAAAPLLRRDGGGVIVNISDLSAFRAWSGYAHHSVSKAGLVHLTRIMARALGPDIRANCIAPGTVLPPESMPADQVRRERERSALHRIGSPEDVTEALLYLIRADFVTGETLVVDGGRMLR